MKNFGKVTFLLGVFFSSLFAKINVRTVDFLPHVGVNVNAAGPVLTLLDEKRDRIIVANTLSSSLTIIQGQTRQVKNIPIGDRAFQHLKSEAMTLNRANGDVCLIGQKCFFVVSPDNKTADRFATEKQFESIAVDEQTGNVFLAGRESKNIVFYNALTKKMDTIQWLDYEEPLKNLNATPPPPIRKVVADNNLHQIAALDGFSSTLYLIDSRSRRILRKRKLEVTAGARWHFAGINEKTHFLYVVIETDKRHVVEAAKIDLVNENDQIVKLPGLTEGVGINYNPVRDEVYVPYDNHPAMHVIDFGNGGEVSEIALPTFANDATALDLQNDLIYVASWAHGEIDVVDLPTRKLIKRVPGLGIIPHMFNMVYYSKTGLIYFPKGGTAVNGTFGAALCTFDPESEKIDKIHTGWAPIDLIELKNRNSFLVFNNEDQFAEVSYGGKVQFHDLLFDYPICAILNSQQNVYLSYGPHQSYWPNVYIWNAKDGILTIDKDDLHFYDRRIPRQAQKMVFDKKGVLYFTQNNWGTEEQFLGRIFDEVRLFNIGQSLKLGDKVTRETSQRVLKYDAERNWLYLARVGETDDDPGVLQIVSIDSQKIIHRFEVGKDPTDLVFDDTKIYVANFGSNSVSVINKNSFEISSVQVGIEPLFMRKINGKVFVILHGENKLVEIGEKVKKYKLPKKGNPDNLFIWGNELIISSHTATRFYLISFDPQKKKFRTVFENQYFYGNTRFDTQNVSFYVNGQFGDVVYSITNAKVDQHGRLWVTDFLAGKLFILSKK
ncbi:MAG: hypothetical protein GXO74_03710 [Calditrichaeota bacterium]|nr:hypothetical protein [Calditrichota bacterium]